VLDGSIDAVAARNPRSSNAQMVFRIEAVSSLFTPIRIEDRQRKAYAETEVVINSRFAEIRLPPSGYVLSTAGKNVASPIRRTNPIDPPRD
jgi:hypothetical protein